MVSAKQSRLWELYQISQVLEEHREAIRSMFEEEGLLEEYVQMMRANQLEE